MRELLLGAFLPRPAAPGPDRRLDGARRLGVDLGLMPLTAPGDSLQLFAGPDVAVADADGALVAVAGRVVFPEGGGGDAAVRLRDRYRDRGAEAARGLGGSFVCLIWDRSASALLLVQDRLPGPRALFWSVDDGGVIFANRLRLMPGLLPRTPAIDRRALGQYLRRAYVGPPRTIHAGVSQLGPGELLRADADGAATRTYDSWTPPPERLDDPDLALARYRQALTDALADIHADDPAPVYLLSGGFDSSVNVALAAGIADEPPATAGVGALRHNTDAPYARRVAEFVGAKHREELFTGDEIEDLPRLIWAMGTPFFEPGLMLTWRALRLAAAHGRTVVGGEGTDQLFGSCAAAAWRRHRLTRRTAGLWSPAERLLHAALRLPPARRSPFALRAANRLWGALDVENWCGVFGFRESDLAGLLRDGAPDCRRHADRRPPAGDLDALFDYGCATLNMDYLTAGILAPYGPLCGLLGVEARSPYLDRPVADLVISLDRGLRTPPRPGRPGEFAAKDLHVRLAKTLLPPDVIERPKQGGAVNPALHLENPVRAAAAGRRLRKSPVLRSLCRDEALAALATDPAANAVRVFLLLGLDLWAQIFADGGAPDEPQWRLSDFLAGRVDGMD